MFIIFTVMYTVVEKSSVLSHIEILGGIILYILTIKYRIFSTYDGDSRTCSDDPSSRNQCLSKSCKPITKR